MTHNTAVNGGQAATGALLGLWLLHRGTKHTVRYIDIAAEDTIDERIAAALQSKSDLLAAIMK